MSLHSKFLIHWTGHDFQDEKDQRAVQGKYVERLRNVCTHGFFMKKGEEEIEGVNKKGVTAVIGRVCFSEVRLSQAKAHAGEYGGLGIGVHRDYIIEREGNPVFYVQNGLKGHVVENFDFVHGAATRLIAAASEAGNEAAAENIRQGILGPIRHIMGYLKAMSKPDQQDLKLYEEMEWRVVNVDRLESDPAYIDVVDQSESRLRVGPCDIKLIVFPDDATRMLALHDDTLAEYFGKDWPIVTTLAECEDF